MATAPAGDPANAMRPDVAPTPAQTTTAQSLDSAPASAPVPYTDFLPPERPAGKAGMMRHGAPMHRAVHHAVMRHAAAKHTAPAATPAAAATPGARARCEGDARCRTGSEGHSGPGRTRCDGGACFAEVTRALNNA